MSSRRLFCGVALAFFLTIACSEGAKAEGPLDRLKMEMWMQATSFSKFDQLRRNWREWERQTTLCKLELKGSSVPISCFGAIQSEEQQQLVKPEQAQTTRAWLIEACLDRVPALSLTDLSSFHRDQLANLPSGCKAAVEKRLDELEYMAVTKDPSHLFQHHRE